MLNLKIFIQFLFVCFLMTSNFASAGDHRPLCEKTQEADLIFEMHFDMKSTYPAKALQKGWPPPEAELLKTSKTGKVINVYKGSIKIDDPWIEPYGLLFRRSSDVKRWKDLFKQKDFSVIAFLKKKGDEYRTTGWAEETAGCSSSSQFSWCEKYEKYKKSVQECLKEKQD